MHVRKIRVALVACGVAACAMAVVAAAQGGRAAGGKVTVAGVIALTGSSDFEGQNQVGGLYPAIYAINQAGGVNGDQVVFKGVDTRGDPADALPAVQQMLATTSNLVAVAGPDTSSAPTIVPVLNQAKIPMMAVAGESVYDRNTAPYFWRLFPPDAANGTAMVLWAKRKGYKRVAAVFGTDSGSQGDKPGVIASLKALHIQLVANVDLTPTQPTYLSSARKVLAAHPDVIMTESDATTAGTFFGELKSLGGLVPIIGTEATFTSPWLTAVKGALGSDFLTDYTGLITAPSKPTAAVTEYRHAVTAVKGQEPKPWQSYLSNPFSITYYDGMIAVALAMVATHSNDPKVFNTAIPSVTNPGKGKKIVYTFAAGKAALAAGKHIEYVGATGLINFDKWHNSFGNQEAVKSTSSLKPVSLGVVTAQQIQAVPVKGA
ncbi:MAG: amino acid ABC transporter substrate-binding protein [Acidobacteriota bacterium]|nr:amino acid ABC transporter substrate-binding protein [Acidobacteriota bacterium]